MRKEKPVQGEYYHLYNRGVNRENIFFQYNNWEYFLDRLRHYFIPPTCDILTYCLMPNHYHLLLQIKIDDFGHKVMHPFSTSYTKAINKQQNRVGSLFQGPYQYRHIKSNRDLLNISRYIHRNPVEAGFADEPEEWTYSSYQDYLGLNENSFVNTQFILNQFDIDHSYIKFVSETIKPSSVQDLFID